MRGSLGRIASTGPRARAFAAGTSLLLGLLAKTAAAQPRAAPGTDEDVAARLSYLERAVEREGSRVRFWHDNWLSVFAMSALIEGGIALGTPDRAFRLSSIVGGTKALIGATSMLLRPPVGRTAATKLRSESARSPRDRLRLAESLLRTMADEERLRRSWIPIVSSALINIAGSYVLWAGYRLPEEGWSGLGIGFSVSQILYWTQPLGARAAWRAYVNGKYRDLPAGEASPVSWSVFFSGNGLSLGGRF